MGCQIAHRYMGGSTLFVPASNSVVTVTNPLTLPTSGFGFFTRYKWKGSADGRFSSNEGYSSRTGSFSYGRQGTNQVEVYAYLDAPVDFATPRRLRFGGFSHPKSANMWHSTFINIYVTDGKAYADEYVNGDKVGATKTVNFTGDTNAPTGNLLIGRASATFNGNLAESRFYPTLTAEQIKNLHLTGDAGVAPLQDNPLDDQPASGYRDTIGGATGTGTATTYSTDTPTQLRTALDLEVRASLRNGVANTDDITVENSAGEVTDNLSDQTFEVVFKPSQLQGAGKYLFSIAATAGANRRYLYLNATNAVTYNFGATSATLAYRAQPHTWYVGHVVVDATAETADIWMNGQRIAKAIAFTLGTGTADITFGNDTVSGTQAFIGNLKTGRVWNVKLTDQEIIDRVFNNVVPYINQPDILKCNLTMNEGAGTIAYDQSGNGNNGAISGATWSADTPSKAPTLIGGNLVPNGDFSYVPVVNVPTTTNARWIDGTTGGSLTNDLFKWGIDGLLTITGKFAVQYDTSIKYNGLNSIKISTTATGGLVNINQTRDSNTAANVIKYGIKVQPNTEYTVIHQMKTLANSGAATTGARLRITHYTATGVAVTSTDSIKVATTSDWTQYTTTLTTGANTRILLVVPGVVGNDGDATLIMDAWFADIRLTEVGATPLVPLSAPAVAITCP